MRPPATQFGSLAQPLDELLGATSRVRILRALDRASGPLTTTALAEETGLTYNAVASALKPLEQSSLVTMIPVRGSSIYALSPDHPFRAALSQLFAAERGRRRAVQTAIGDWAHTQSETLRAIWLFGSAARHEDTFQSDIDIALVADDHEGATRDADALREMLAPIAARQRLHLSVMPYDRHELQMLPHSDRTMWGNLTRDAIPLYGPDPSTLLAQLAPRARKATKSRARRAK